MKTKQVIQWIVRFILLTLLYYPIWILGALVISDLIPQVPSEPGLVREDVGMLLLGAINTALIIGLIVTSRWHGWKLSMILAFSYYGAFTFITQIESWYFLTKLTIPPELLPRLFLMGLSIPLIFIPLAVLLCKKWKDKEEVSTSPNVNMPFVQWVLKFAAIAVIYVILYWLAGYYIAWQNPDLRAFYGSPGEITPFFEHTVDTFRNDPGLLLLQLLRGMMFALIALPIIYGSKVKPWITALLVGFLLAAPHLGHILPNPFMPVASVRLSHMIETFSSTFIFGLIIVWLFHRKHT